MSGLAEYRKPIEQRKKIRRGAKVDQTNLFGKILRKLRVYHVKNVLRVVFYYFRDGLTGLDPFWI